MFLYIFFCNIELCILLYVSNYKKNKITENYCVCFILAHSLVAELFLYQGLLYK